MISQPLPVFLGGTGCSGTTLVIDLLGLHSQLSPVYETGFVISVCRAVLGRERVAVSARAKVVRQIMSEWTGPLPHLRHHKGAHERYHHGPHHVRFDRSYAMERTAALLEALQTVEPAAALRRFCLDLFDEHARRAHKPRWINKTPAYIHGLPVLHHVFGPLRFIHAIRDGRGVLASVRRRPRGPKTASEVARWWVTTIRQGRRFGAAHPEMFSEVRYEDVLEEPVETLERLFVFIEAPDPLGEAQRVAALAQLDASRACGWRQVLTARDVAAFEDVAGDLLSELGYPVTAAVAR